MAPRDSDDEDITSAENDSGAVTPSTAATSVVGSRRKPQLVSAQDGDDSDEEEPVRPAGCVFCSPYPSASRGVKYSRTMLDSCGPCNPVRTRNTPRRSAAASASKKFVQPPADGSSDLSEAEDAGSEEDEVVRELKKRVKGKGKATAVLVLLDSDEDQEMEPEDEDDSEDVKMVRDLAKSLGSSTAGERVGNGRAVGKSVASKLAKGKGKAVPKAVFQVVVPSRGSSKSSSKGSSAQSKGKGNATAKAIVISSGSEGSDFEPSELDETEGEVEDSDVEMELAEFNSDIDSSEEDQVDHQAKLKKMAKRAKVDGVDKIPPRRGAEISIKQRNSMKKLSQVRPPPNLSSLPATEADSVAAVREDGNSP